MRGWPLALKLLAFYPKKASSQAIGWLASRPIPRAWRESLIGRFAAHFGVNVADAEKPLADYVSIQDFFTRRLASGIRPQAAATRGAINSPADGRIIASGRIEKGLAIQAKGLPVRRSSSPDGSGGPRCARNGAGTGRPGAWTRNSAGRAHAVRCRRNPPQRAHGATRGRTVTGGDSSSARCCPDRIARLRNSADASQRTAGRSCAAHD